MLINNLEFEVKRLISALSLAFPMYTPKNIFSPYDINELIKIPSIAHIIPYETWDSIPHKTIDLLRDIRQMMKPNNLAK